MAVVIYLADSTNVDVPSPVLSSVCLESGAEYWFLYRYFEGANLDRSSELIDLYGGAVIDGYQLHRLQTELEQAERDVTMKPDVWLVLIGWSGVPASKETEDWRLASKATMLALIGSLLALVRHSSASGLKLVSSGD